MKRFVKIWILNITLVFGGCISVFAQSGFPLLSQQMFSRGNLNPAAMGISNYIDAFFLARKQWVGFENAPFTQMLNLQGYVPEINSSVAASVASDMIGLNYGLNAKFGYTYHFRVGEKSYLSLGINGGVLYKNYRGSQIVIGQDNDPGIPMYDQNDIKPDFDFGMVYQTPSFSIGVSATHLTSFIYEQDDYFTPKVNYHGFIEYRGKISEGFVLIPNISAGYLGNELYLEGNLTALFMKAWWIGFSYRLNDAIIGMTGLQIGDGFRIGYAYDYSIGAARGYSRGTHEIMLNIRIKSSNEFQDAIETPRFFE